MKCDFCGKEIADISSSFKLGERYYHNELCYFESIKKDFNKKIKELNPAIINQGLLHLEEEEEN